MKGDTVATIISPKQTLTLLKHNKRKACIIVALTT